MLYSLWYLSIIILTITLQIVSHQKIDIRDTSVPMGDKGQVPLKILSDEIIRGSHFTLNAINITLLRNDYITY